MAKTCGNCRFWRAPRPAPQGEAEGAERVGDCRRYPPVERKEDHDFCGEHSMRKPT